LEKASIHHSPICYIKYNSSVTWVSHAICMHSRRRQNQTYISLRMSSHFEKYYYTPFKHVLGVFCRTFASSKLKMNAIHIYTRCVMYPFGFWDSKISFIAFHVNTRIHHNYSNNVQKDEKFTQSTRRE
jgi:hypothetical protein